MSNRCSGRVEKRNEKHIIELTTPDQGKVRILWAHVRLSIHPSIRWSIRSLRLLLFTTHLQTASQVSVQS